MIRKWLVAAFLLFFLASTQALVFGLPEEKAQVFQRGEIDVSSYSITGANFSLSKEQPFALIQFDSKKISVLSVEVSKNNGSFPLESIPQIWVFSSQLKRTDDSVLPSGIKTGLPHQAVLFDPVLMPDTIDWIAEPIETKIGDEKNNSYFVLAYSEKPVQDVDLTIHLTEEKPGKGVDWLFLLIFLGMGIAAGFFGIAIGMVSKMASAQGAVQETEQKSAFAISVFFNFIMLLAGLSYFFWNDFFYTHIEKTAVFIFLNEALLIVVGWIFPFLWGNKNQNTGTKIGQHSIFKAPIVVLTSAFYWLLLFAITQDALISGFLALQLIVMAWTNQGAIFGWVQGFTFLLSAWFFSVFVAAGLGLPTEQGTYFSLSGPTIALWLAFFYLLKIVSEWKASQKKVFFGMLTTE